MPSAASFSRREAAQLAKLVFFLDHQIGRYVVADALRVVGAQVEAHVDHFDAAAPDIDWIPEVGRRGWVLITRDQNIRRNPLERFSYEAAALRGFVMTGQDMSGSDMSALLVKSLSGMVRRVAGRKGPLMFSISRGGTFSKLI